MAVQVQQETLDHCRVALTIEVPPDEVQKAMASVFNSVAKRTAVPGFRPGKAPRHLLKRFIDEGRVREMALERALSNAYNDALRQTGVSPYSEADPQVELQEEELDPEKGFSFKATVPLKPHVHLGDLEGLTGRRVVTRVTDEDVTRELEHFRERVATFQPTDEPAAEGDRLRATVQISVDGEVVPEASFDEPALLQIGANLEDFDAGLTGAQPGEEKTFDFTYPEDFADEALRGKKATARVNTLEVQRRTLPELDELVEPLNAESLDDLKSRIRETLQAQADAMADSEVDEALIKEVVRRSEAHFPDEMVERETSARLGNLIRALEARKLSLDDYLAAQETDLAALQESTREQAREAIQRTLVLLEVAYENKLRVADKDIEEEIGRRAAEQGVKVPQMRRLLEETGEMNNIHNRLFMQRIAAFLREKAEIKEV
jgi:trigger factor